MVGRVGGEPKVEMIMPLQVGCVRLEGERGGKSGMVDFYGELLGSPHVVDTLIDNLARFFACEVPVDVVFGLSGEPGVDRQGVGNTVGVPYCELRDRGNSV